MKVKDAMHKGAEWRESNTNIREIANLMTREDIGCVPIGENDRLIGMVTDRDIATRAFAQSIDDPEDLTARHVMSEGIIYCMENETLEDAVMVMEQKQIRRLPVLNDKKRLTGMLSIGDVGHAAPQSLTGELIEAVSKHHDN
jgi:CBS domain-containing protein